MSSSNQRCVLTCGLLVFLYGNFVGMQCGNPQYGRQIPVG